MVKREDEGGGHLFKERINKPRDSTSRKITSVALVEQKGGRNGGLLNEIRHDGVARDLATAKDSKRGTHSVLDLHFIHF